MEDLNTVRIDSKAGDVVEKLLSAAGAPGALIGRAKSGSVVVAFRSTHPHANVPNLPGVSSAERNFELASKDGSTRVKISTETVALEGYKLNRDVPLYELSVLPYTAAEVSERIIKAAFPLGLSWASQVDHDLAVEKRIAQYKADVAAGRIKIKSEDELQAERDAEIVKANEGHAYTQWDGPIAQEIIGARTRHAARLEKVQAEHAAELQAIEDRKLLARVERGELPDYLQRVTDARRRQAERQVAAA